MLGGDKEVVGASNSYFIKLAVLILLCFQNAGHALMSRYSQGILKEVYSTSEVVLMGEILKLLFSAYCSVTDKTETDAVGSGFTKLLWLALNSRKIIILVVMYMMTNMLAYYALARVEASVYTVILQLKIFTTAGLSVLILGKHISMTKWRALFLLVVGCILVVSPTFNQCICDEVGITNRRALEESSLNDAASTSILLGNSIKMSYSSILSYFTCSKDRRMLKSEESTAYNSEDTISSFDSIAGIVAVLAMVTLSGYAACYFEGVLKEQKTKMTVWERNFQLALYSIVILIGVLLWERQYTIYLNRNSGDNSDIESYVPFKGWTINTVIIVILQSGGGLLVAATLKYADAILKTLATCGAIVISALLGYFFLGGSLDVIIVMGCLCTILAIFNYTFEEKGDSH